MSCHPRVTEWTVIIQPHMPHLTKPQATVLALWSLGMVLARSCALTAVQCVSGDVAGPQRACRAPTVARVLLRGHGQTRASALRTCRGALLCAAVSLGGGAVGGHPIGAGPRCHDLGHALYRVGAQRGLSRLCHPGGLDRPGRHGPTCLAPGVAAHATPGAPGGAPGVDGHRAWPIGPVCPLAVSAHHAAGVAPVFAHQHRGHLSAAGPGAWSAL